MFERNDFSHLQALTSEFASLHGNKVKQSIIPKSDEGS